MGEFSVDWLRLREPYDHAARRVEPVDFVRDHVPEHFVGLELAAGTGSGVRWLAPHLPGGRWTLVDHDAELLAAAGDWPTLQHDLEDLDGLPDDVDLVSCQALLDLVSHAWLLRFADWLADRRVPLLAALTVDGRVDWSPADPRDVDVQAAFRAHQLTDRGFGPSPGPRAAQVLADHLRRRGFDVLVVNADWRIPPDATSMVEAMIDGTAGAAAEMLDARLVEQWRRDRRAAVGSLGLTVGHLDLAAVPRR
jgi:hypothetical protein